MHSLRQQFMLCFLRLSEEDIASFTSTVEFIDSVHAVQQIISPFLNEAAQGGDSVTTVVSISTVIFTLYGAKAVREKASSKLPKVADLLCERDILKANFGMLMRDIEQDSDSTFLLEVETVSWKYIVDGELDDVSMANLIARQCYEALVFFSYHVGFARIRYDLAYKEWLAEQVFSKRKSLEAVFRLLSSSSTNKHAQMFVLQLLGGINYECVHPSPEAFRNILLADPAIEDSIMRILKAIAKDVNGSPLVLSGFQINWEYHHSASFRTFTTHFHEALVRPVRAILSAVKILISSLVSWIAEDNSFVLLAVVMLAAHLCLTRSHLASIRPFKHPEAVQNLIQLSIQGGDEVGKVAALRCLYYFVLAVVESNVSAGTKNLERLAELVSGANGKAQYVAFQLVGLLTDKNTCGIRARASGGFLMCLVDVISTKVEGESNAEYAPYAIRLLVVCAAQNNKALRYLTGLLEKHMRSILRVDATVFLMDQMSLSTRDPEKSFLPSLQTIWRTYFPGQYWKIAFPVYFHSAQNLEASVSQG
ncbi:hypothetical protein R1sor_003407 [Riccia sorocarpa]|uniref:Uncharacterized protein n=1 Tax=Riccia sorocarpa TaxID=122646 RepID=A0ABD3H4W7_9MARC